MVRVRETDLHLLASVDVSTAARHLVIQYRNQLESYIQAHPVFLTSLKPVSLDPLAPPIIKEMLKAAQATGVGPMAAVAGAVAEFVGRDLLGRVVEEIMVENGGDIFLRRLKECVVAIFSGESPLSNRIGIQVPVALMPLGICTSSGTVGHSLSFGQADAVTVIAASVCLADAAATRLGNEVQVGQPLAHALAVAKTIKGLAGVVIVRGDELGVWGEVQLVKLD